MAKKKVNHSKKKEKIVHSVPLSKEDRNTEKILIENFVALQRVMTNLSEKFDGLSTQISKLLNLFEISAKALAEKEFGTEKDNKDVKKVMEKLDGLLEQNKTIAKGLLILHDGISPNNPPEQSRQENTFSPPPVFTPRPIPNSNPSSERYQKSISSGEEKLQPPKFKLLPK